jgi:class 3 adenylate cyclase
MASRSSGSSLVARSPSGSRIPYDLAEEHRAEDLIAWGPLRRGPGDARRVRAIAVHTAGRVMGAAGPGEVLVSATVLDLVDGSGPRSRMPGAMS